MFFTTDGYEQATRRRVADHRAARMIATLGANARVLDLCCGVGGPGLLMARRLGCTYLGVDADPGAIARARQRAAAEGAAVRFDVASVPPAPRGDFDVVMLLETLLAFRDKRPLLTTFADKLAARAYIESRVGAGYLPELLAVTSDPARAMNFYESALAVLQPLTDIDPWTDERVSFWPWQDTYVNALVMTDQLDAADAFLTGFERLRYASKVAANLTDPSARAPASVEGTNFACAVIVSS